MHAMHDYSQALCQAYRVRSFHLKRAFVHILKCMASEMATTATEQLRPGDILLGESALDKSQCTAIIIGLVCEAQRSCILRLQFTWTILKQHRVGEH